jgi:predicted transcriptional regulator
VKYRSRTDIAAAILENTIEGARRTQLMYKAYLSYPQLKEYLAEMLDVRVIRYSQDEEKTFHITQKGMHFLKIYRELDSMIPKANMLTKVLK